MAEITLVKTSHGLVPATQEDADQLAKWRIGETVRGKYSRMRNAKFHAKFFKLLELTYDYWEPAGGLIPAQEKRGIHGLAKYLETQIGHDGALGDAVAAYILHLETDRAERFPIIDKSREAMRDWLTIEAGYYTLVYTPGGVRRERRSIQWAKMDETEFSNLYKDVFATCWRLVLSSKFDCEADALAVADQLSFYA